jgi:hypothetical protein
MRTKINKRSLSRKQNTSGFPSYSQQDSNSTLSSSFMLLKGWKLVSGVRHAYTPQVEEGGSRVPSQPGPHIHHEVLPLKRWDVLSHCLQLLTYWSLFILVLSDPALRGTQLRPAVTSQLPTPGHHAVLVPWT